MIADILRTCAVLAIKGEVEKLFEFVAFVRELFVAARDQELLDSIYDKALETTAKIDAALSK